MDPIAISEKYNGLEWGARGTSLGIYDKYGENNNHKSIGYGAKNSAIILKPNGEIQEEKVLR